jgi:hypothetical protein
MRAPALFRLVCFVCLFGLGLAGCEGELESPERFSSNCSFDVQDDLLRGTCGGSCHGATRPEAGLDLSSPGVGERLLAATNECDGGPLIDAGGGYLLEKVGPTPPCGAAMPLYDMALDAEERRCLIQYVDHLVALRRAPGATR